MLRLVSRGNAIIAELLRLSDYIPAIFTQNYEKVRSCRLILTTSPFVSLGLSCGAEQQDGNAGIGLYVLQICRVV